MASSRRISWCHIIAACAGIRCCWAGRGLSKRWRLKARLGAGRSPQITLTNSPEWMWMIREFWGTSTAAKILKRLSADAFRLALANDGIGVWRLLVLPATHCDYLADDAESDFFWSGRAEVDSGGGVHGF